MDHKDLSAPACAQISHNRRLIASGFVRRAPEPQPEPSDLAVAIRVAQQLLDNGDAIILRESLRILLRALGAEPVDEDEAVRRSVDAQFPAVAAFLADERGGQ
jgi:hypothetical protein